MNIKQYKKMRDDIRNGEKLIKVDGTAVILLPIDERFEYIFQQRWNSPYKAINRSQFEFNGLYDKENDVIYDDGFYCFFGEGEEYENLAAQRHNNRSEVLNRNLEAEIGKQLTQEIQSDPSILQLSEKEKEKAIKDYYFVSFLENDRADDKVKEAFVNDTIDDLFKFVATGMDNQYNISNYHENLIKYLKDPDSYIEKAKKSTFELMKGKYYVRLLEIDEYKKALLRYLKDIPERDLFNKEIVKAMKNQTMKSANITLTNGNQEVTVKEKDYGVGQLSRDCNTWGYRNYNMSPADRKKINQLNGHDYYFPEQITKITYGRKTIYQKPNIETLRAGY